MGTLKIAVTHFEVYVYERDRWILHARYTRSEREAAVNEAKMVERALNVGVKVVREEYDPGRNDSSEATIYLSSKLAHLAQSAQKKPQGGGGGGGAQRPQTYDSYDGALGEDENPFVARRAAGPAPAAMGAVLKLTIIILASLALAAFATAAASGLTTHAGFHISRDLYPKLMFAVFVLTFLLTALPLAMTYVRLDFQASPRRYAAPAPPAGIRRGRPQPRPAAPPTPAPPPPPAADPLPDPLELAPDDDDEPVPVQPPKPDEQARAEEKRKAADATAKAEAQKAEEEARRWAEAQQDAPPPAEQATPTPTTYGDDDEELAGTGEGDGLFERQRLLMMRFLGGVVSAIKAVRPQLDAFNKFGVDLMLAGGIDVLGERTGMGGDDRRKILRETIEVLGTKASMAQTFVDKYEEYLLEARYMQMVQAGRDAMNRHMADESEAFGELAQAIDAWNRPTGATQMQQGIITVMFTDIVGSTDMTQSKGDHAAQGIVRLHNSIVRAALAEHGGREVKHTGDGIMASFGSASNGVSATVSIQRSIWEHNAKNPSLPLRVRIGINSGEPIVEEDDLFGTTVQLAARVCAKAGADQIFCSNVVRELAAGKGFQFGSQGDHELKGFPDRVPLYEVLWNPAAATPSPSGAEKSGRSG